jgi:isopentenyl diphosphate isomerase/L-lactate dehydrogenase-like FMN-dependent dehydrogenase
LKGVLHTEDAVKAFDMGFDGVVVSNHGGRQQDQSPSSVSQLSAVRNAVSDDALVFVDGGIMRGIDIIKALGLGANAVMLGRAYIYGLAAAGYAGLEMVISILKNEILSDMRQFGISDFNNWREIHISKYDDIK